MKFADSLRNIKPLTETEVMSKKIRYICECIYPREIKEECYKQARLGKNVAKIHKSIFQTEFGTSFSVDFEYKPFFKRKKTGKEDYAEKIVQETLGSIAEDLGLTLVSVNSVFSSNFDARSSYEVTVTFRW